MTPEDMEEARRYSETLNAWLQRKTRKPAPKRRGLTKLEKAHRAKPAAQKKRAEWDAERLERDRLYGGGAA